MGSVLTGLRECEESVREWIDSLDPSAYVPATHTGATWHASDTPGDLLDDGRQLGALLYDVRIEEGEWRERLTSPASQGGCSGSVDVHDATIVVQFSYPCRSLGSERREDWSAAGDAAEHILRALASSPYRHRRTLPPERTMAPAVGGVGSWIVVTVRVATEIWFHLDPSESGPAGAAPVNYVIPGISGDRGVGETLTAWVGLWTGTTPIVYTYQWLLDGSPISGATSSTYVDPDGDGQISVTVTATNSAGTANATSQPLGSGGGPVDCATNCAAEIAAATAAGAASITNEFRSFGKRLFAGETPTIYNPSGLATGAYSVDAAGSVTVPLATGISAGLPSTGYALVLPATSSLGRALVAGGFSWAVLRACIEAEAGTTGTRRFGVCVMTTSDPTTAQGWGAGITATSPSTYNTTIMVAATAGAWVGTTGSTALAIDRPAEGAAIQQRSSVVSRIVTRIDPTTGLAASSGAGATVSSGVNPASFAAGTWICMWWGTSDALIAAGNYTGRAVTSINDSPVTDSVGV